MLKKTITYTDYNDVERKEDFYFNLNKVELLEMDVFANGQYAETIQAAVDSKDMPRIMTVFKEFIEKSYGIKSADGKSFEKSPEIARRFMQSEAYAELLTELATVEGAADAFVLGILPKDYREAAQAKLQEKKA